MQNISAQKLAFNDFRKLLKVGYEKFRSIWNLDERLSLRIFLVLNVVFENFLFLRIK